MIWYLVFFIFLVQNIGITNIKASEGYLSRIPQKVEGAWFLGGSSGQAHSWYKKSKQAILDLKDDSNFKTNFNAIFDKIKNEYNLRELEKYNIVLAVLNDADVVKKIDKNAKIMKLGDADFIIEDKHGFIGVNSDWIDKLRANNVLIDQAFKEAECLGYESQAVPPDLAVDEFVIGLEFFIQGGKSFKKEDSDPVIEQLARENGQRIERYSSGNQDEKLLCALRRPHLFYKRQNYLYAYKVYLETVFSYFARELQNATPRMQVRLLDYAKRTGLLDAVKTNLEHVFIRDIVLNKNIDSQNFPANLAKELRLSDDVMNKYFWHIIDKKKYDRMATLIAFNPRFKTVKNDIGLLPAFAAVDKDDITMLALLIDDKADAEQQNDKKESLIDYAIKKNAAQSIKFLATKGVVPVIKQPIKTSPKKP